MSATRCTNCGGDLSATCCNHPGRVWDFPMDFPPDPIPGLEAEIAQLTAERDAAMAGLVKVKPLVWESFDAWTYWATSAVGTYRVQERNGVWKSTIHRKDNDDLIYEYTTDGLTPNDFEAAQIAAQADYEARILAALQPDPERAEPAALAVWYGSMPESNGKANWTAILHRKEADVMLDGFCFARSEYPDRVRYEADRMRWIVGELRERPHILDYDAASHSGYTTPQPAPAPQAREITVQEAAEVPEVKELIRAAAELRDDLQERALMRGPDAPVAAGRTIWAEFTDALAAMQKEPTHDQP